MRRVQKKGQNLSSQEYYNNATVQHKKRKATLCKIVSPAMIDTCEEDDKNKNIISKSGIMPR